MNNTINEPLPRLSTRLLLSMYGKESEDLNKLWHTRMVQLKRLEQANDTRSTFLLTDFTSNTMKAIEFNAIKSDYKSFIDEVNCVADSATQSNAAKTMYNIITKRDSLEVSYSDACSYFGKIHVKQWNSLVQLAQSLERAYNSKDRVEKLSEKEFGSDLKYHIPFYEIPEQFDVIDSNELFQKSCEEEKNSSISINDKVMIDKGPVRVVDSDTTWLAKKCSHHVATTGMLLDGKLLTEEICNFYSQTKGDEDLLQMKLFDLIGETGFELMLEIMQNLHRLKNITSKTINEYFTKPASNGESDGLMSDNYENLTENQRRKREQKLLKRAMKESEESYKTEEKKSADWLEQMGFSADYLLQERALGLQKNRDPHEVLEKWTEDLAPEGTLEYHEKKGLPADTERKVGPGFEEVNIPAAERPVIPDNEVLIEINNLEPWAQKAFAGTKRLNRIQSKVFETAYNSSENMLVCAPTGAGKTNIAMLTMLQLIKQHIYMNTIDKTAIKAIYVAPMKALAQEVVSKFSERLSPLGLVVKEYTGDMQLTKQEVMDSQLLVCTPEKYDVVTRKGGDGSLGTLVSLIIIDEVHLLADERGAVIETIVARTQRYVESSQRFIRVVGLSATLPNYQDVAKFLRVNPVSGLYFFGPEYRPIPLAQTFIGITEKQRVKRNEYMNRHAYDKMIHALQNNKQVMIFVHSRKETSKTAEALAELCAKNNAFDYFENVHHEKFTIWKRQVDKSRSQEVQQLFYKGMGVHHAGMLRADRTMTEQLFECGLIKVLCCTATLAWGVNLPAHTVIIKGTELYEPERGGFVDLSILDVLQIFGRAGRPQYDNTGHAIMITPHKTLNMYLGMLNHQAPIESALIKALPDHMNAEIVNGTINNIREASAWLSYTFLFVRMCRNPIAYGIRLEETYTDPQLETKRLELVTNAAETLDDCMMARYDRRTGNLAVTDLGRIASHYYITYGTIEAFNTMLMPHLGDPEALHVLCSSAEFDQLKVRPEEISEIESLKKNAFTIIRGTADETPGKVNILLQNYLTHSRINSFTLQSDTNYVAQNASRITRALFEICLKRGWSTLAAHYLTLCKSIDRRVRVDASPLRQFDELPREVIKRLEETAVTTQQLRDMEPREIGQLVHNQKLGGKVLSLAKCLPLLNIDCVVKPITRGIIKVELTITPSFTWIDRYHGYGESFWIWVEDGENEYIYHAEQFTLAKKQYNEIKFMEFTIPVRDPLPPQYYIKSISDSWVGCDSTIAVSFKDLIMPSMMMPHTDLLDLHPVPKSALNYSTFESIYKFSHFNPIQSQTFHVLYHTDHNVLVGAPTGSGKTITGELAILRMLRTRPKAKAIYVAPLKALARERLSDWQKKLGPTLGLSILELTGDVTPDIGLLERADILIVTPEKWDSISRGWQKREYVKRVELVIIDEIHLLGVDRGPVLEVIVSRMRFISTQQLTPIRFIGLSTALANPRDLADWLGIGDVGVYNFRPSVRPIPMSIYIQGFPGKHYCPRMATMNKPAYAAIQEHSPKKPALIFVSSRRQTRLTALDLISFCASDDDPKQFLHMSDEEITNIATTLRDRSLRDTIVFGIGIHHAGLDNHDRSVVEELFLNGKIQILVCTSTLAWGVNLPCHLVIVKGTEYFDVKTSGYVDSPVTDILQMIGRAGRPQFDESGVACIFVHEPKKNFYRKFLHEPFPVESSLHNQLHEHINAEINNNSLHDLRDCIEYLTWTYFYRRLIMNPSYYNLSGNSVEQVEKYLENLILLVINDLEKSKCVEVLEDSTYQSTFLGKIASFYYLHYTTVGLFHDRIQTITKTFLDRDSNNNHSDVDGKGISLAKKEMLLMNEILFLLCDAPEFSELPVRHNEDILNEELADQLTCDIGHRDYDSPHAKAYLLLIAHFQRCKLPISDYINDTKSVLDQFPRVLNSLIDIAAELGELEVVLCCMKISQMVIQALPADANELEQMPQITAEMVSSVFKRSSINGMQDLLSISPQLLEKLLKQCFFSGTNRSEGNSNFKEFMKAYNSIPRIKLSCQIRLLDDDKNTSEENDWTDVGIVETAVNLPIDSLCQVKLNIFNSQSSYTKNVHCPKYHRPKSRSWWTIVGANQTKLLALKRVNSIDSNHTEVLLEFMTPEESGVHQISIHLVNDSQLGIDTELVFSMNCY